jgi:hypothetical protein
MGGLIMSDLPNGVAAQPAGQPAQPSPAEGAPSTPAGQYLTREEFRQEMAQALAEHEREQQSQRDKLENRVKSEIQKTASLLKEVTGADPTPDQLRAIEQQTRQNVNVQTEEPQRPGQDGKAQPESVNPIVAIAQERLKEIGVQLEPTDPEAAELEKFNGTPNQWLRAVEKAANAKKARISQENAPPGARLNTIAGGSPTPGNAISGVKDIGELFRLARQNGYK